MQFWHPSKRFRSDYHYIRYSADRISVIYERFRLTDLIGLLVLECTFCVSRRTKDFKVSSRISSIIKVVYWAAMFRTQTMSTIERDLNICWNIYHTRSYWLFRLFIGIYWNSWCRCEMRHWWYIRLLDLIRIQF